MTTETEAELARKTSQLSTLSSQNERLVRTLKEAREQIVTLREEIERLAQPPSSYAVVVVRRHTTASTRTLTSRAARHRSHVCISSASRCRAKGCAPPRG